MVTSKSFLILLTIFNGDKKLYLLIWGKSIYNLNKLATVVRMSYCNAELSNV